METYKQQVDDLNKRLGELQTENESLENRNRLLEKVVQMKDQKPFAAGDSLPMVYHQSSALSSEYEQLRKRPSEILQKFPQVSL